LWHAGGKRGNCYTPETTTIDELTWRRFGEEFSEFGLRTLENKQVHGTSTSSKVGIGTPTESHVSTDPWNLNHRMQRNSIRILVMKFSFSFSK
jgi:hypothetical protein